MRVSLFLLLTVMPLQLALSQAGKENSVSPLELKRLIVTAESKSDSVIAVPPIKSVVLAKRGEKGDPSTNVADLASWFKREAAANGLQSTDLKPWHIVVEYDQYDEDGDNIHSGVYEEYWAGPKKYKRIYKSDNLNQTDYATDRGLYRVGDQQWADPPHLQVREETVAPFTYGATFPASHGRTEERVYSGYKLSCVVTETESFLLHPPQYCFEPGGSVLRYSSGSGWNQIARNQITQFQGCNVAREVEVTDAGKPYLKLKVTTLELISTVQEADFAPPLNATLIGERVQDVQQVMIKGAYPQWPASLRGHFKVAVEIVIGKDGHVISARGVSGPPEGYRACEDAAKQYVFEPFLVLDRPVEVQRTVSFLH